MGASLALAGRRLHPHAGREARPYAHRPPSRTPGEPVSYATAMEIGGIAQGLLVTSYDGRPIKIEGNPQPSAEPRGLRRDCPGQRSWNFTTRTAAAA